ncbi:hypothetical protein ACLBOM_27390 [Escherichia coli]
MRQATAALTALSDVDNDEETRKILSTLSVAPAGNWRSRRWTICKTHKTIWRLITASWFRYRRSPNACRKCDV